MTDQPGPLESTREFAAVDLTAMLHEDEDTYTGPSPKVRLIAILVVAALVLGAGATTLAILLS
ncbi:hypothetical protein ATM97_31655 [Nocardia sp. MH4]|uniref:hypothetical protein n=1 Tax=Nocardia sp. MH4 TaxID=1768677 RepID=UPI001C4E3178|nr:hypothetical protein [Nocardia sp. MH4]MBW0273871.1 hypothetical protein [Nocardia sp. MH4]